MTVGGLLARLGGADPEILEKAPSERPKFVQMAIVLLTTAGLAVVSMAFALHDGLKVDWGWSVVFGLLWGAVVLNLDRLLVLSMADVQGKGRLFLMAVPRLLMAAVLGVVISTPLVLRVFAGSIEVQIARNQLESSAQLGSLQDKSAEKIRLDQVSKKIAADQAVLAGALPQDFTSPRLQAARQDVTTLEANLETAQRKHQEKYEEMQCELYGEGPRCKGASSRKGRGPLWREKQKAATDAAAEVGSVQRRLSTARNEAKKAEDALVGERSAALKKAQDDARRDLTAQQAEYGRLSAVLREQSEDSTSANLADDKLPAQIKALFDLGSRDDALGYAHLAVFALFFMVEMLPVTVKVLLKLGGESPYDLVAKSRADEQVDAERLRRSNDRRRAEKASRDEVTVEEGRARVMLALEEDMRTREEALGRQANEHVAAEMGKILDVALREWSDQVKARLAEAVPGAGAGPQSPPSGLNGAKVAGTQTTNVTGLPDDDDL
ncbi:hypothetical protein Skr01_23970 [Sphaerisporangium krabiense]|uniref:DUF4407 domain-containing protein n=1 Tax=Sphaerisporangium krabiense TaxID=763782 RepID=A0A7W8Z625_9ACTN|nr:DUF4407 domain-containing protein [Sphaerisporangium krabiense]MBB5628143.1 hypothetical protein [Sphaerisporangium krabiense]GII62312.1 hypothetical protein Skr01_23970 [Sphaerisporangium krabiense]